MFKTTIGIAVNGMDNILYLADFLKAGNDLLELVSEVDVTLAENRKPTVDWKLKVLSYSSPATLVVEPDVKDDSPDNRSAIIETVIEGMNKLKISSERPRGFNDKSLEIARDLAMIKNGTVDAIVVFADNADVECSAEIMKNVDFIIKPGRELYGSVQGTIERMNSHKDFLAYIYEPILGRRIKIQLMNTKDDVLKNNIISLYEKDVIASGLLFTNVNGEVISAKITDIKKRGTVPLLKNASEVTAIWNLTGGIDPSEYVRRMRDVN